ncbi:MAG: WG repeat-containing protein [Bacteroidetes bacterium]|nr:WG repeat-containing protein [Bacteroidota bacterium]
MKYVLFLFILLTNTSDAQAVRANKNNGINVFGNNSNSVVINYSNGTVINIPNNSVINYPYTTDDRPKQTNTGDHNLNVNDNRGGTINYLSGPQVQTPTHVLKIRTNTKSYIYVDGRLRDSVTVEAPAIIELKSAGIYALRLVSAYYSDWIIEQDYRVEKTDIGTSTYAFLNFKISPYLHPVHKVDKGKYAYFNIYTGELVTLFKYEIASEFNEGVATVGLDGKLGALDDYGMERIPLTYDPSTKFNFRNGYSEAIKNGKYGLIDENGKATVPFIYDFLSYSGDKYVRAVMKNTWGYVDTLNNVIIPFKYTYVSEIDGNWIKAATGGWTFMMFNTEANDESKVYNAKWGIIDLQGNVVLPVAYRDVLTKATDAPSMPLRMQNARMVPVQKELDWNFIYLGNWKEKSFGPFADVDNISKDMLRVGVIDHKNCRKNKKSPDDCEKYGCLSNFGRQILPIKYDNIFCSENILWISKNDSIGFYNVDSNRQITDLIYEFGYSGKTSMTEAFIGGLAKVYKNGYSGFINKRGKEIIPVENKPGGCHSAKQFGNFHIVGVNDKFGIIRDDGTWVTTMDYDEILLASNDNGAKYENVIAILIRNGKYRYITATGKMLNNKDYDYAGGFWGHTGIAIVGKENKYGLINIKGSQIVPFIYDYIKVISKDFIEAHVNDEVMYINDSGRCLYGCH